MLLKDVFDSFDEIDHVDVVFDLKRLIRSINAEKIRARR